MGNPLLDVSAVVDKGFLEKYATLNSSCPTFNFYLVLVFTVYNTLNVFYTFVGVYICICVGVYICICIVPSSF